MKTHAPRQQGISRREVLKVGAGAVIGGATASLLPWERRATASTPPSAAQAPEELFRELDAKIEAGMARYHIPGVAIGVLYQGQEYVRGYGVTNVDEPAAGRRRHPLSHRLDHEDLYGHNGHAVGRAGPARPERPGAPLPARFPRCGRGSLLPR